MDNTVAQLIRDAFSGMPGIEPTSGKSGNQISLNADGIYFPNSHVKALDLNIPIVVGMRGAGKSFWSAALASKQYRQYIENTQPRLNISERTNIYTGFGSVPNNEKYPSQRVFDGLTDEQISYVWQAVLAQALPLDLSGFPEKNAYWSEKADWIKANIEQFERSLQSFDSQKRQNDETHLFVFDALDRLASSWGKIRIIAKALFSVALEVRYLGAIKFKIFIRPDMFEDPKIWTFPDSSKLKAVSAKLTWTRNDLYSLFYQSLANSRGEGSKQFRLLVQNLSASNNQDKSWNEFPLDEAKTFYTLPNALKSESCQKELFTLLAGSYMGGGPKKGYTYSWLPTHLMDGFDQASPRSFICALKGAAERTKEAYPDSTTPLHYKGIHHGVREASRIRVDELKEDYPWIAEFMEPLGGEILVPFNKQEILNIWEEKDIFKIFAQIVGESNTIESSNQIQTGEQSNAPEPAIKLPPNFEKGPEGILQDLENLGVLVSKNQRKDRLQMPDVYRIAFGMGRKGGVKPLR